VRRTSLSWPLAIQTAGRAKPLLLGHGPAGSCGCAAGHRFGPAEQHQMGCWLGISPQAFLQGASQIGRAGAGRRDCAGSEPNPV